MTDIPDNSVALVVTSPPYFAGKEYEQSLGEGGVPASYLEYLDLLADVFAECRRVLEPGGRIAVNVANLGRKPFRSLAGDVARILEDLGLLLRGEIVWWKGRAAGGSCAWGTFQSPVNPVLRDVTERIVIASKGRFDRALTVTDRRRLGLPNRASVTREEFLEATTDLWELPPESARRVGHPAPFPIELPRRLIELFTFEDDVVLDPFMGSGSTAIAAVQLGRSYVGYENDASYAVRAEERLRNETAALVVQSTDAAGHGFSATLATGRSTTDLARSLLVDLGLEITKEDLPIGKSGLTITFSTTRADGTRLDFSVSGSRSNSSAGLRSTEVASREALKAALWATHQEDGTLLLLSTSLPGKGSAAAKILNSFMGTDGPIAGQFNILDEDDRQRLVHVLDNIGA